MDHAAEEQAFVAWLESEGAYVHKGLNLFGIRPDGQGRSAVARTDIKRGEQLLLIPEKLTMHLPESVKDNREDGDMNDSELLNVLRIAAEEMSTMSPFLLTVLLFMGEENRGDDSLFSPYFRTLPEEAPPSLIAWSLEQRNMLCGTSLEQDADAALFENAFRDVLMPLMERHPHLWPEEIQNLERARRTAAFVQSRAFHMKEENWVTNKISEGTTLYLIPAIDMVNHTSFTKEVNTELTKCKDMLTMELKNGQPLTVNGYFVMKAEKNISAGEEILHSYGDLSDAALLRIYGFVSGGQIPNPSNLLVLPYAMIYDACHIVMQKQMWPISAFSQREVFLSKRLLCSPGTIQDVTFDLGMDVSLPETLLTIVQVLLLPDEEFEELEEEFYEEPNEAEDHFELGFDYLDDSVWTEMVLLALTEMVRLLKDKLDEDPKSLISNRAMARDADLVHMVGVIVEGERQILSAFTRDVLSLMSFEDDSSNEGSTNSEEQGNREQLDDSAARKKPRHS